jgi:hypothetical protein
VFSGGLIAQGDGWRRAERLIARPEIGRSKFSAQIMADANYLISDLVVGRKGFEEVEMCQRSEREGSGGEKV